MHRKELEAASVCQCPFFVLGFMASALGISSLSSSLPLSIQLAIPLARDAGLLRHGIKVS